MGRPTTFSLEFAASNSPKGRPRIGITSGLDSEDWLPGGPSWRPYAHAIEGAGGAAIHLDASTRGFEGAVLDELDGVLFTGGKDIHLDHYLHPPDTGGEPVEEFMARYRMRPEPGRDSYELPLLREALDRDLPVLGICRGCQVLNVALGGRLILDIALEMETLLQHTSHPSPDGASSIHAIRIEPGTLLASILPPHEFTHCNSRHHQAVRLDHTFSARVCAVSPEDGLVEAIEVPGRRWAVGVQWHPEHPDDHQVREQYAPLFRAFVEAAG